MSKKRREPDPVEPVVLGHIRYEAPLDAVSDAAPTWGATVIAHDVETGAELWRAGIFRPVVNPRMERDKQDVFITRLTAIEGGAALLVESEDGAAHRLDLADRAVTQVRRPN